MDTVKIKWKTLRDEGLAELDAPLVDLTRPQNIDSSLRLSTYGWVRDGLETPIGLIMDLYTMERLLKQTALNVQNH